MEIQEVVAQLDTELVLKKRIVKDLKDFLQADMPMDYLAAIIADNLMAEECRALVEGIYEFRELKKGK